MIPCHYCAMGYLLYDSHEYEFEDRTLAHVKIAVTNKLRKQESFLLSWTMTPERGSGRISLWMTPSIPLGFRFSGSRSPQLNEAWVKVLQELSNSPRGLVVVSEKEAEAHAASQ